MTLPDFRTPSLSEFVEGFSYEIYSEGYGDDYVEDVPNWYSYTVGVDSWRNLSQLTPYVADGLVRVPMPKVFNKYKCPPKDAVYIGRPSAFGNPFEIGKDGTRDEVCDKYAVWIYLPEQASLRKQLATELQGKNLVCFCTPHRCHGETLLKIANL